MDLFGKKRIKELEAQLIECRELNETRGQTVLRWAERNKELTSQVDFLIRSIRKTDDIIFSISQCTDWSSMQLRVNTLVDEMTARKVAESNRISALVTQELHTTYAVPQQPPQITKQK